MFLIFFVLLILMTSIEVFGIEPDAGLSSEPNYIYKCCPEERYVGKRKTCVGYHKTLSFSVIKVYDENYKYTGKSLKDVFSLKPRRFMDKSFRLEALDVTMLDFNVYLIENGILKLEFPNMYNRWTSLPIANYCVDYRIMVEPELIKPRFWVQLPEYIDTKSETYLRMGGLRISKMSTNSSARGYNSLEDSIQVGKKKLSLQQSATTVSATLVSCFFLLLVLVVYFLLPELQNLCGLILMAYVFSLFMAFLLLFIIQIRIHTFNACIGLTMSIYFFYLAAFCWMSVMSYDVWWTFRGFARARTIHQRGDFFKFLMYSLFAFGVPLLMTIGLFELNANQDNMRALPWFVIPHVPKYGCFLEYGEALYYLYIPGLILILCNWIFCVMTAIYIRRLIRGVMLDSVAAANPQAHYMHTLRFLAYLKLSLVVGFCWLLEIANVLYSGDELFWIIDVTSIIIALTTFLIFVCKEEILKKLFIRYLGKVAMRWYPPLKSYSTSMNQGSNEEPATLQSKESSQPNKLSNEYAMAPISVELG